MTAIEATKLLLEEHKPMDDGPYSIIQHTYCSCGAYESYIASDGYRSIGPVKFPCKQRKMLEELLLILEGDNA